MASRTEIRGADVEFRPMSPEEIERTMQFLLQQQAQFAADSARNDARWAELRNELTEKTRQLTDAVLGLTSVVGMLAASQLATDRQLQTVDQQLHTVDKQLQTTESHLDDLIRLFERHLREDHGAQPS
jgi:chromosome segregation ATPase